MELKLKDEDKLEDLYHDKDDDRLQDIRSEFAENVELPVIKTTSTYTGPKEKGHGGFIIKMAVLVLFLAAAAYLIFGVFLKKPKELMDDVNMDTEQLEKELGIKLTKNDTTAKRVRHYSRGSLTSDGNGDIAVLYLDGKQLGIHVDSDDYKLFNIEIGDARYDAEDKMTYQKEDSMQIINDMYNGTSTSVFYYNRSKNDCIMINYNDKTNRVVSITYFNDFSRISENLSFN